MFIGITEDVPGAACAPVLRAELLERIHALNLDFLELLIADGAGADHAPHEARLPLRILAALAKLSLDARKRIACVPYALFSLCFDEARFWRTACASETSSFQARHGVRAHADVQGVFCEFVLIEVWHLARSQPRAAQVLHALSPEMCSLLAATPLWQIKRIACDYPGLLTARWPHNPAFWPDLLRLSGAVDAQRLAAAQLLGFQLIAAELAAATKCTGTRGPFKERMRPRLAPALHARTRD